MKFRTFAIELFPTTGADLPKRILVGKWGNNSSVLGDYTVNETTARELPLNLHRVNFDTIDLDFEHNTVPGSAMFKAEQEPRKRAAFGKVEVVPGEGVYLHTAENWTPEGKAAVGGKHFQDLSPAILVNAKNEVVFVHSVALARHGATRDLELQLNSADPLLALFSEEKPNTPTMLDYKKLLLSILDLPDTATDGQITEKVKTEAGETDQLKTMSASLEALVAKMGALEKAGEKAEREGIAARALAAGKIIPQSAMELPLAAFTKLVEELPADQVPLEKRTPANLKTHSSSGVDQGTSIRAEICQNMGITKEQWDRHNKTA